MIAELGVFSLILALLFSLLLSIIPLIGIRKNGPTWINSARYYVVGQFAFIALAYSCLTFCFLTDDFSVIYVLSNSSKSLPWFYKLCAVWGGHEGSMLLWVAILSTWAMAVNFFSRDLESVFRARVLVIMGALTAGLLLFLLTTSNPFLRQFQFLTTEGRDLNPLLQDPGFLFHPPLLYMGYVGFSVAFSFAVAALWAGRLDPVWAKWTRPWTLLAWTCLTLGITLGSWWAYRELGWGGWWFWDPVENASFMPWLVGTALIHSLAVSEQRQQFMAWTILLAITAFSLSLVGTFLVRSGVLTSVHAFAVDPQRGLFILGFLIVVVGGSLSLFASKAHALSQTPRPSPVSRENALLLNNVLLVVIMLTVLTGTMYPLIIDSLGLGKISVGAPYFNTVFVPLMIPLLLLMGIGPHIAWQKSNITRVGIRLLPMLLCSIIVPIVSLQVMYASLNWYTVLGLILAFWIVLSTLKLVILRLKKRSFFKMGQSFIAMIVAHLGIAVCVIGVCISTGYGIQDDVKMQPGQHYELAGFSIHFIKQYSLDGPNYKATEAQFSITKGAFKTIIYPQKREYTVAKMLLTDSAISANAFRDIYVALGEPLTASAWSVRLYYKPFVRWIWAGGLLIFLGGLIALTDRRYYYKPTKMAKNAL